MIQEELDKGFNMWYYYIGKEQLFIDKVEKYSKPVGVGEYLMFDIEKFDGKKWPKYLFKKLKKKDKYDTSIYFVNENGWPIKETIPTTEYHNGSNIYINYEAEETVMVSYDFKTNYPNFARKIKWENGRKASYHVFSVNGGASYLDRFSSKELALSHLKNDSNSFILHSEYFVYNEYEKIEKVITYNNSPGIGAMKGYKNYEYENGILQKIISRSGTFEPQLEYVRKQAGFQIGKFLEELAELFYDAIVKKLLELNEKSLIVLLNISYQSVGNYWPFIYYATETQAERAKKFSPGDYFYTMANNNFDIETTTEIDEKFAILNGLMDKDYKKHYGEKMWYLFAQKLNTEKHKYKILSKDFFCYTYGDLDQLDNKGLKKNGATKEQIAYWKKEGFM